MQNARWVRIFAATLLGAGLAAHPSDRAQAQSSDPGVAFVSTLNGDVTVQRGDSGDVEAAGVNAPLMVGDYVSTGPDSRAEVQFDYGHAVRVGPSSQMRFAELGSRDDTVQLAAGTVGVGVVHATSQFTQVQTPSVTVRPRTAGFYRVTIDSDGTTAITVRSGTAAILLPHGTRSLDPGSTMLVWGPADNPSFRYERTFAHDSFDQWNTDRDTAFARSDAYQYAAPSIPGLYDLSAYGQWQSSPQYGYEWLPNVPNGWTPYSTGQWTSEPYYGWTWVDNAPWGYAPSHYGRWYRDQRRNRWAWAPGSRTQAQYSWSPALVAFIGFGGAGVSASLIDNIGWVALAPNEQPHPWWGSSSTTYATTNVTNIQNSYVNSRWPSAVRGMSRQAFAAGQYQHVAPVSAAYLNRAVVMRSALPVVPAPQALRYTQRAAATAHAPSAQAFHAFAATPRAPQTFAQQRNDAAAVAQHASVVHAQPAARPQAAIHPQRPAVVHQPQTAVHAQPAAVHAPQAAVHPQTPAVVHHPQTAVHAQPAAVHAPQAAVRPQSPAVVRHPQTAVHAQPAAVHAPQAAVRPQSPAVVQHPQTAVHAQPAAVHAPQAAVHAQPAAVHAPQAAVRPQPVVHQPQAAVRPQPAVVHQPQAAARPPTAVQQKHPQPVVQAPRGSAEPAPQHPPQ